MFGLINSAGALIGAGVIWFLATDPAAKDVKLPVGVNPVPDLGTKSKRKRKRKNKK